MNRKAAAIVVIILFAVAAAVTLEAMNPSLSPTQQGSFTGSVSNSYGESLSFNATVSQQWLSQWGQTASWYVGSTPYTKTHYAHDFKMTGQLIQNGSAHYKVQFRASYSATQSVRWSSERSNRYLGILYSNSTDEQISNLATALSFATSNGSNNAVTFQVFIDTWATGAVSGTILHASSSTWQPFASNQLTYMSVTVLDTWTYATAVTWNFGTPDQEDPGPVARVHYQDTLYHHGTAGDAGFSYTGRVDFTFNVPSSATQIRVQYRYRPTSNAFPPDNWLEDDPIAGKGQVLFVKNTGGTWVDIVDWGSRSYLTWYTETSQWVSASTYRQSDGSVYVRFKFSGPYASGIPVGIDLDYIWLQYEASASWFDTAYAVGPWLIGLCGVVGLVIFVRRRQRGK